MPTALLSVYDKEKVREFAAELSKLGYTIIATQGTNEHVSNQGFVGRRVEALAGKPILEHRVVTLSRRIHAGLLAPDTPEGHAELRRSHGTWIDLVYVNLYPIHEAIAQPDATLDSVTEMTDVGGRALLMSAVKGGRLALYSKEQLELALTFIRRRQGSGISDEDWFNYVLCCASSTARHIAEYSSALTEFLKREHLRRCTQR